jgi:hypothetical protein
MRQAQLAPCRQTPTASRAAAARKRPGTVRRPFRRTAFGFWLGGVGLGAAGCILGACQPYRHPVAVAISVLWWGIYFACFGASLGGLIGRLTECRATPPSRGFDDREPRRLKG